MRRDISLRTHLIVPSIGSMLISLGVSLLKRFTLIVIFNIISKFSLWVTNEILKKANNATIIRLVALLNVYHRTRLGKSYYLSRANSIKYNLSKLFKSDMKFVASFTSCETKSSIGRIFSWVRYELSVSTLIFSIINLCAIHDSSSESAVVKISLKFYHSAIHYFSD